METTWPEAAGWARPGTRAAPAVDAARLGGHLAGDLARASVRARAEGRRKSLVLSHRWPPHRDALQGLEEKGLGGRKELGRWRMRPSSGLGEHESSPH